MPQGTHEGHHEQIDAISGVATTGHSWDDIQELNNPLPRWWLWTFYASIAGRSPIASPIRPGRWSLPTPRARSGGSRVRRWWPISTRSSSSAPA